MYLSFYGLKEKPFDIETDPKFLWQGEKHSEGLATLEYGLREGSGFVVLAGDAGMGKTTLVNALIESLDSDVQVSIINHPTLKTLDLLRLLARTYDPHVQFDNKVDGLLCIQALLRETHQDGKTSLLIIDDSLCDL